jgi:hypothetical protein
LNKQQALPSSFQAIETNRPNPPGKPSKFRHSQGRNQGRQREAKKNSPNSNKPMARLSEEEKSAFLALARSTPLPHQRPPVLPIAEYLRLISDFAKLPHPPKPVRFSGRHWKL